MHNKLAIVIGLGVENDKKRKVARMHHLSFPRANAQERSRLDISVW